MTRYSERRRKAEAMMRAVKAPMTRANLDRLARKYEASYRKWRASKRPPTVEHLLGALQTARAFHSLARSVS